VSYGSRAAFLAFMRLMRGNGLGLITFALGSTGTTPSGSWATSSSRSLKLIQHWIMAIRCTCATRTECGSSLLTRAISDECWAATADDGRKQPACPLAKVLSPSPRARFSSRVPIR
jgi:hypothetical protein